MTKIIRVEHCGECEHKLDGSIDDERQFYRCSHKDNYWVVITENVKNKTLHPNCPLDDEYSDFQKEVLITAEMGMEIRQDATKNIRAVWEKYKNGLPVGKHKIWTMEMSRAIDADIESLEGENE